MSTVPVRVMVLDVWDGFGFEVPATFRIGDLKARALATAKVERDPGEYLVKFRGAEIADGGTIAEAGVVPNAELIVMRRRRVAAK